MVLLKVQIQNLDILDFKINKMQIHQGHKNQTEVKVGLLKLQVQNLDLLDFKISNQQLLSKEHKIPCWKNNNLQKQVLPLLTIKTNPIVPNILKVVLIQNLILSKFQILLNLAYQVNFPKTNLRTSSMLQWLLIRQVQVVTMILTWHQGMDEKGDTVLGVENLLS